MHTHVTVTNPAIESPKMATRTPKEGDTRAGPMATMAQTMSAGTIQNTTQTKHPNSVQISRNPASSSPRAFR